MTDSLEADQSATLVITHHVLDVHHDAYEN